MNLTKLIECYKFKNDEDDPSLNKSPVDPQNFNLNKKKSIPRIDFALIRKKENSKYRQLCKDCANTHDHPFLDSLAIFLIKKHGERYEEEVKVLCRWTATFKFFQDLNSKQSNVQMKAHQKCCARFKYVKVKKGQTVFAAGDIPDRFYIIMSGKVNVLIPTPTDELQHQIQQAKHHQKFLSIKERAISIAERQKSLMEMRKAQMEHGSSDNKAKDNNQSQNFVKPELLPLNQRRGALATSTNSFLNFISISKKPSAQKKMDHGLISERHGKMKLENTTQSGLYTNRSNNQLNSLKKLESPDKQLSYRLGNSHSQLHLLLRPIDKFSLQNKKEKSCSRLKSDQLISSNQSLKDLPLFSQEEDLCIESSKSFRLISKDKTLLNSVEKKKPSIKPQVSMILENANDDNIPIEKQKYKQFRTTHKINREKTGDKQINNRVEKKSGEIQHEFDPRQFDLEEIESDPIYLGMGDIRLSDIDNPEKFISSEGVLLHTYIRSLEKGEMFGELGLIMKKPRAATIIAKEDTEFVVLEQSDFIEILQASEQRKLYRRMNFFASTILKNCSKEVLQKFQYGFKKIKVYRGQFIFQEGDQSSFVYLIKRGTIEIQKRVQEEINTEGIPVSLQNENPEKEQIPSLKKQYQKNTILPICQQTTGSIFGESEIIQRTKRQTNALCITPTSSLYVLPSKEFLRLMKENGFLKNDFTRQVRSKEDFASRRIEQYVSTNVSPVQSIIQQKTPEIIEINIEQKLKRMRPRKPLRIPAPSEPVHELKKETFKQMNPLLFHQTPCLPYIEQKVVVDSTNNSSQNKSQQSQQNEFNILTQLLYCEEIKKSKNSISPRQQRFLTPPNRFPNSPDLRTEPNQNTSDDQLISQREYSPLQWEEFIRKYNDKIIIKLKQQSNDNKIVSNTSATATPATTTTPPLINFPKKQLINHDFSKKFTLQRAISNKGFNLSLKQKIEEQQQRSRFLQNLESTFIPPELSQRPSFVQSISRSIQISQNHSDQSSFCQTPNANDEIKESVSSMRSEYFALNDDSSYSFNGNNDSGSPKFSKILGRLLTPSQKFTQFITSQQLNTKQCNLQLPLCSIHSSTIGVDSHSKIDQEGRSISLNSKRNMLIK